MIKADFHVHTTYCDGKDTPRKTIEAAMEKGLEAIGFSAHSYTFFDESYCIKKADIPAYRAEIESLKEEFADKIRIYCGVEQDLYSAESTEGYEYVIGSVHYVKKDDVYYSIDHSSECFETACHKAFGGDYYAFAESYFTAVAQLAERVRPSFIGHFDLISKFNENGKYFDENHPRYTAAWMAALDALLPFGIPFEVNTGAISRGYKTLPYPSEDQLRYIAQRGGRVLLSGDAHAGDGLCFSFENCEALLQRSGVSVLSTADFIRTLS